MKTQRMTVILAACAISVAGCGSEGGEKSGDVSAQTRIERCVEEYPDSTKAECEEWEQDGELDDDGKHQDHENM